MEMRKARIKWGGNDTDLAGPEITVGQKAPDFTVIGNDMKPVTLKDGHGKVRIFSALPSLDTPVCDTETRRFNTEAAAIPNVEIWTISMDLPFAQKRWCGAAGIDKVKTASDHRNASFGEAYGVLDPGKRLLARAVFVVDKNDVVRHVEYVKEVREEPSYAAALEAAKAAAQ
jgi:thiol peroxidase